MRVIIDGDAQPCREDIIALSEKYKIKVINITSVAHYSDNERLKYAENILVDNIKEATDLKILNIANKDDVVITCDTGLALILTGKGITVLSERGYILNNDEILEKKFSLIYEKMKILRSKKGKRKKTKGQKVFTHKDKMRLLNNLEKIFLKKGLN